MAGGKRIVMMVLLTILILVVNLFSYRIVIKEKVWNNIPEEIRNKLEKKIFMKVNNEVFHDIVLDNVTKNEITLLKENHIFFVPSLKVKPDFMPPSKPIIKSSEYNDSWNDKWRELIGLDKIWEMGYHDCSDIIVAVIDTGVDYDHPDLKNNIYTNPNEICDNGIDDDGNGYVDDCHGWNFTENNNDPNDDYCQDEKCNYYGGHGTIVAGAIGADGYNNFGAKGVCWKVKILPIRAVSQDTIAYGIVYAVDMGAKVINISQNGGVTNVGGEENGLIAPIIEPAAYIKAIENQYLEAFAYAWKHNVFITLPAGNNNHDNDMRGSVWGYLRRIFPNVITVGAAVRTGKTFDDLMPELSSAYGATVIPEESYNPLIEMQEYFKKASYSNWGWQTVDLFAPTDIYSTSRDGNYNIAGGTSLSTPVTAGVIALLESIFKTDDITFIKKVLYQATSAYNHEGFSIYGDDISLTSKRYIAFKSICGNVLNFLTYLKEYDTNPYNFRQYKSSEKKELPVVFKVAFSHDLKYIYIYGDNLIPDNYDNETTTIQISFECMGQTIHPIYVSKRLVIGYVLREGFYGLDKMGDEYSSSIFEGMYGFLIPLYNSTHRDIDYLTLATWSLEDGGFQENIPFFNWNPQNSDCQANNGFEYLQYYIWGQSFPANRYYLDRLILRDSKLPDFFYIDTLPHGWNLLSGFGIAGVDFRFVKDKDVIWKWDALTQSWAIYATNKNVRKLMREYGIKEIKRIYEHEGFWFYKGEEVKERVDDKL